MIDYEALTEEQQEIWNEAYKCGHDAADDEHLCESEYNASDMDAAFCEGRDKVLRMITSILGAVQETKNLDSYTSVTPLEEMLRAITVLCQLPVLGEDWGDIADGLEKDHVTLINQALKEKAQFQLLKEAQLQKEKVKE